MIRQSSSAALVVTKRFHVRQLFPQFSSAILSSVVSGGVEETTCLGGLNRAVFVRRYRGEATESEPPILSTEEQRLLRTAKPKADAILAKHVQLPNLDHIPSPSLGPSLSTENPSNPELEIRRKRLIYRSKQRGWLEVDLLLGTWASEYVPTLSVPELDEYEVFVNQETIDIYNIITLRVTPLSTGFPTELHDNRVVQRIQEWARSSPLGKADPDAYKEAKQKAKLI